MNLRLTLAVATVVIATMIILAFMPHRVYVDADSNLRLQTLLGVYKKIPMKDAAPRELPAFERQSLIRSFGLKLGKYASGNYFDIKAKQKYFLFLKGADRRICFVYKNRIYVVDVPENADSWPLFTGNDSHAAER